MSMFGYGWGGYPPNVPVVYLVIGIFATGDWFLHDVINDDITVRKWTTDQKRAMAFEKKEEAETVGHMICGDADQFKITSVYKHSM